MKYKLICLLLCCLSGGWFSGSLLAQQIVSKPISFGKQLSSNSLHKFYQDKQGYIWAATLDGLARYNGYEVQEFRNNYNTPELLTNNNIVSFTEDDRYLWVGTKKGVNLVDKNTYRITPLEANVKEGEVRDLLRDKQGNLWVAIQNMLYKFDGNQTLLKSYPLNTNINAIYQDKTDNLWILTWGRGLFRYAPEKDSFVNYPRIGEKNNPFRLLQDNSNRYWLATWGDGIWRFDPYAPQENMYHQQQVFNSTRNYTETIFYDIVQDDAYGYLWVLSLFELYTFRVNRKNELEKVDINQSDAIVNGINRDKLYNRITKDNNGSLWVAASDESYVINFDENKVSNYVMSDIRRNINLDANIECMTKDNGGMIWFNQARYGLCLFDEKTRHITYGMNDGDLRSLDVRLIIPSKKPNTTWSAARYLGTIWKIQREGEKMFVRHSYDLGKISPSAGIVSDILEDRSGNFWVSTDKHLFLKPADSKELFKTTIDIPNITALREDNDGYIWASTPKGLFRLKYEENPTIVNNYPEALHLPENDRIKTFCIGNNGTCWVATTLGRLYQFDPGEQQLVDKTNACQLKGDDIQSIQSYGEDVWIAQNKYLIKHNVLQQKNTVYAIQDDNIQLSSFYPQAAFIDENGNAYFGGNKGFIRIHPEHPATRKTKAVRPLITDIKIDNHSLLFDSHTQQAFNSGQSVALSPEAKNIEIFFSSMNYIATAKTMYAYKMDGVDTQWSYIANGKHTAFYNRLGKGKHTFRVKASDEYGNWSEQETVLVLHKAPAFYETWYAYLAYVLLLLLLVFCCIKYTLRRIAQRNNAKIQEELTQTKFNYFTNISHELLTPLTIISCVADDLEKNQTSTDKQVGILRTNVGRLKRLLQQILDFRKIESNKMPLNVNKVNITSFISTLIATNFQPLARSKGIHLMTDIEKNIWGYIDTDKIDKILFNLLSNAIKFTPENKYIFFTAGLVAHEDGKRLVIAVKDEGIGIANKEIKHIFTKFYSNRNHIAGFESNGIGLSLTKELVTLHHGQIHVESEVNEGTVFTVEIPIDKDIYSSVEEDDDRGNETDMQETQQTDEANSKPCILFIDDSEDLRELIWSILHTNYTILTAENGEEGLHLLTKNTVDVIICDVMMPKMDGLEFCRRAKSNEQTNHIPIVMLTAKNAVEDQIDCYKAGAESYIAKPFEMKMLQARIENLLNARELRQRSFQSKMEINISNLDYQTADEKFLNRAIQCVEKHLSDPDFDIIQMAAELNVSKPTLNRKFRAITGLTPLNFIRNVKLKHACVLLKKGSVSISEVAYSTGFSSPKYFRKCFIDEFKISPTEYQNNS